VSSCSPRWRECPFAPLRYPDRPLLVQKHGRLYGQKEPKRSWDPNIGLNRSIFTWHHIGANHNVHGGFEQMARPGLEPGTPRFSGRPVAFNQASDLQADPGSRFSEDTRR
jgi:hypothetical protein